MRERILEILKLTRNNALTVEEIYNRVYHTELDEKQLKTLNTTLKDLIDEKLIYCTNSKKGLYILNPFKEGIFHFKRNGECFVISNGEYIFINSEKTLGCLEGDKVLVRITDYNTYEGTIKEIIDRHGIIAEVKTIDNKRYAVVGKDKYQIELDGGIVDGMLIGIKIDKTKAGKFYRCTLDRIIGHKNAPKLDEKKILYQYGIEDGFSKETILEINNIPSEIDIDDIKNRKDLRNDIIFTIDGDDTKDIDDAISVKKIGNNYILGVHIADVSYYVQEDSAIDLDARNKATSVYMPGVVSPMYPVSLSNGICSLNPNVDRFAITCQMEFDNKGSLINFDIFKSVIHSRIQMTYKSVNKILEEGIVLKEYEEYVDALKIMQELSAILHKMRTARGALDFDSGEVKIEVNDKGKVTNISLRKQKTAENLIEQFMLAANETVATYIYNMGLNGIYRVHDYPNFERLQRTINIIKSYGEKVDIKLDFKDPKMLQKLLSELRKSENFNIYSSMLLRCMAKACYKNNNEGHFGVGIDYKKSEAYTHFTSPIRRYPDTTIHRILTNILTGDINKIQQEKYKSNLIEIANHSSEMEVIADSASKEADKMKMAEYMSDFVENDYFGKIVGFTHHGMFVQLDNFVEGRIGYNTMDDFYHYMEEQEIIVGERKKKIYRLGDKIKVKLIKASKETREIDFEMVKGEKDGNRK